MRLPDDNKRRQILSTAAEMFSSQPYHKVRLDDVAAVAGVGKGTLYVYFQSKEDLYFTIIYDGLSKLVARLRSQLSADHGGAMHRLGTIVAELVDYSFANPEFFELMKTTGLPTKQESWNTRRDEMFNLIEQTIREGIASGEFADPNPLLTARFIPGLVRSAMFYRTDDLDPARLKAQICGLLEHGVVAPKPAQI